MSYGYNFGRGTYAYAKTTVMRGIPCLKRYSLSVLHTILRYKFVLLFRQMWMPNRKKNSCSELNALNRNIKSVASHMSFIVHKFTQSNRC